MYMETYDKKGHEESETYYVKLVSPKVKITKIWSSTKINNETMITYWIIL